MEGIKASSLDCIKLVPIGVSRVQVLGKLKNEFQSPLFQWEKKMVIHYLLNCDSRLFTVVAGFHKYLNPMWVLSILK